MQPTFPPRHLQSEESGGRVLNNEDSDLEPEIDRHEEDEESEEREGESDIEFIIMNLYSKMKNLENKYIDLANFYKQELVKTSSLKKVGGEDSKLGYGYGQSRTAG